MPGSSLPDQIKNWVQQRPHKWWLIMSIISGAVGLICFVVSFFNHHLKAWNLMLKLSVSIACIALIFVTVLFAKNLLKGSIPWIRAHLVFSAIIATYIFTFLDKEQEKEADIYGLESYASFAVMFLSLAIHTQLRFLGETVYFFLGVLVVQLMKIKWWLVFPGACFSYPLIIFSSIIDELSEERDRLAIQTPPQLNTDIVPLIVSQPVQHNDLVASFRHALRKLNGFDRVLVRELQHPLKDYITYMIDQVPEALVNDPNFLADRISPQVESQLNVHQKKNKMEKERIKKWIKVSNIALRILFPNERRLCHRVFGSSFDISNKCFMQICSELARILLDFADHFAKNSLEYKKSHYLLLLLQVFRTLQYDLIIPSFELLFPNIPFSDSLWTEAINVKERLCRAIKDYFFTGLEDDGKRGSFRGYGIHQSTVQVMDRLGTPSMKETPLN
ncbi:hypothetical protein PIB30_010067 [Stylosanthes scabra]|uniref:Exocyst subunit Exo70 family protein n=1 Tax=Stylosanthes scabra TaxID=79078 RepID=A0ABU6X4H2_9FABA|nr:hypothetical protein [Stylosanthes scabra]